MKTFLFIFVFALCGMCNVCAQDLSHPEGPGVNEGTYERITLYISWRNPGTSAGWAVDSLSDLFDASPCDNRMDMFVPFALRNYSVRMGKILFVIDQDEWIKLGVAEYDLHIEFLIVGGQSKVVDVRIVDGSSSL